MWFVYMVKMAAPGATHLFRASLTAVNWFRVIIAGILVGTLWCFRFAGYKLQDN
jgi:hypothetical protein